MGDIVASRKFGNVSDGPPCLLCWQLVTERNGMAGSLGAVSSSVVLSSSNRY